MKQINQSISLRSLWYNIVVDKNVKYMPFYILKPCKEPLLDDRVWNVSFCSSLGVVEG